MSLLDRLYYFSLGIGFTLSVFLVIKAFKEIRRLDKEIEELEQSIRKEV